MVKFIFCGKFNISFFAKETMTWRKSIFDAESEWEYYERTLEKL